MCSWNPVPSSSLDIGTGSVAEVGKRPVKTNRLRLPRYRRRLQHAGAALSLDQAGQEQESNRSVRTQPPTARRGVEDERQTVRYNRDTHVERRIEVEHASKPLAQGEDAVGAPQRPAEQGPPAPGLRTVKDAVVSSLGMDDEAAPAWPSAPIIGRSCRKPTMDRETVMYIKP